MIDLTKILNTDAAYTLREALESHVYWQLSDPQYRNDGYVSGPGSDDPEMRQKIIEACEIDAALAAIAPVDEDKLSVLLDEIEAHELGDVPTYQCACSWVGGDPDEGHGRGTSRYRVKGRVGDKIRFTRYRPADPKAPTCPACWAKDQKRVVVLPVEDHARCEVACGLVGCDPKANRERGTLPKITITHAGGYDPRLGPAHPANQDPTLEPSAPEPHTLTFTSFTDFKRQMKPGLVFTCEHHVRPQASGDREITRVQTNALYVMQLGGTEEFWCPYPKGVKEVRVVGERVTFLDDKGEPAFTYHSFREAK